jgi:hypothetical protein
MPRKTIVSMLLFAVFLLSSCATQGGGVVSLYEVNGQPAQGSASIGLSYLCNDHKDAISGTMAWNDQATGVQFTARLPWTPVAAITPFSTCDELAAFGSTAPISAGVGVINAQGQQVGTAMVEVAKPGVDSNCAPTVSGVFMQANFDTMPQYTAIGCLDRGTINFR